MKQEIGFKGWFFRVFVALILLNIYSLAFSDESNFLEKSTVELINLSGTYAKGTQLTNAEKNQWIASAKLRGNALHIGLQKDPATVVKFFLPKKILTSLPYQINPYLESEVSNIKGTLELRTALYLKQKESIQYLLHAENGEVYFLYFADKNPKGLRTGATIKVRHAYKIQISKDIKDLLVSSDNVVVISHAPKVALPESLGPQKTIVMLVNFQDNPSDQPWTIAAVKDVVFFSINNMYYESSYHQTTVVGDTVGWYTLAMNSNASCDDVINILPGLADSAATQAGVNLSSYDRRVYMFPGNANCGWGGYASIGKWGAYSMAWINGYNQPGLTGHELGHNLGLYHSHYLQCPGSTNGSNCTSIEYGDGADVMGSGDTAHFNSFQKDNLGWLNYLSSPPIQTITASGIFTIAPYETFNSNVKALKVLKDTLSDGSNDYYYLEFRQGIGFDSELATCSNCDYTKGVVLHQANNMDADSSNLLDLTPNDNNTNTVALLPGQSFQDPNAPNGGVTFLVNSVSATGTSVNINFGGQPPVCISKPQTMTISPTTTQYVFPGSSASYIIQLVNNDNSACAPSTFNLTATGVQGVTQSLSSPSLTIAPGGSGTVTLKVTSSATTLPGLYPVTVKAINASIPGNSTAVIANFGVQNSTCTRAIPLLTLSPSVQTGAPGTTLTYNVSVRNNDKSNCTKSTFNLTVTTPGGFSWYISPFQFNLAPGATGTGIFSASSPGSAQNGDYTIKATITNSSNPSSTATTQATWRVLR